MVCYFFGFAIFLMVSQNQVMGKSLIFILIAHLLFVMGASAQDPLVEAGIYSLPSKYYGKISSKVGNLGAQMDKRTTKYLRKIQRQEKRIYRRLWVKDSAKAKELFGNIHNRYVHLQKEAKYRAGRLPVLSKVYNGRLDSLSTAFIFLDKAGPGASGLQDKLKNGINNLNGLQNKLDEAEQVKKYLKERKKLLSDQLQRIGMVKELKKFNKQIYYYQQQVLEYKEILNTPSRLEGKLLGLLGRLPGFKNFFADHSQLAALFNLPGSTAGNNTSMQTGLQTRASVLQELQSRLGSSNGIQQMVQQNIESAQSHINQLKARVTQYSPNGGSSDDDIPDFKPNRQKTKPFWQRIELGVNFQNTRSNNLLPAISNIGFSVGYRLNDKSVLGIGVAYKMGWGRDIQHIKITHQGVGLRTFIDWNLKGSFYLSGGYEMNYNNTFKNIEQLKHSDIWQQSGLVGVSKIVSLNSRLFKKTKVQLMWDLLSYRQIPRAQPIIFRVGYSLK